MKTTMKKIFSLMLVAVLLVGALPMSAMAATHTHVDTTGPEGTPNGVCDVDGCKYAMGSCDGGHLFGNGPCTEAKTCQREYCGVVQPAGTHSGTTIGKDANKHWYVCDVCAQPYGAVDHSASGYEKNADSHWQVCACGQRINEAAHSGGSANCAEGKFCEVCGQAYTGADASNHKSLGTEWVKNTTQHWKVCSTCSAEANKADHTWANADCDTPKTCTTCGYEQPDSAIGHDWKDPDCDTPKTCADCGATEGPSLGHDWAPATCTAPQTCKREGCGETRGTKLEHSYKNGECEYCGKDYVAPAKYNVTFKPNYNNASGTTVNVTAGTQIYGLYTPTRVGYSFAGWYWDASLNDKVRADDTVTSNHTVYAKWIQNVPHEVYVKVYTNGNTKSVAKYVDLYGFAQDGVITLRDVEDAVSEYIKPNNNAGLKVYGPFDAIQWDSYCIDDYYRNPREAIDVKSNEKTVIYAMVHNAKIGGSTSSTSGSKADSSNPKTGDMIFMPAMVMGLSASALAVAFYLNNKKRAV